MSAKKSAFAGAFAELRAAKGAKTPRRLSVDAPTVSAPVKSGAKYKDDSFEKTTLYLLGDVKEDARHKSKKSGDGDLSELVNKLLREYVNGEW